MARTVRDAKAQTPLVVDHNPGLEERLAQLTGEEDEPRSVRNSHRKGLIS